MMGNQCGLESEKSVADAAVKKYKVKMSPDRRYRNVQQYRVRNYVLQT